MKHKLPFVSIIIPVYSVELYIEDCIRSVMAQVYDGPIECILVDDCSPDRSIEIAESMLSTYSGNIVFRFFHHKKNRGLSAARNTGMKAAYGDYIFFLDSDDEITPDCIESLVAPLAEREYDFLVGDYKVTGTDIQFQKLNMKTGETRFGSDVTKSYAKKEWMQIACNKLYNRHFILRENLSFKEGLIHEDELWSFQIACTAQSITAVNKETYIYRIRENSITTANTTKLKTDAWITIVTEEQEFLKKRNMKRSFWCFQLFQKHYSAALQSSLESSFAMFCQNYKILRKHNAFSKIDIICANRFSFKGFVRDSHCFLPTYLGAWVFLKRFCNNLKQQ